MKKSTSILVGVALLLVLGGAAVAVAQVAPSPEPGVRDRIRREGPGKPWRGLGFHVLHSDGVAVRRDGTQVEFRTQTGIIRAVDAGEITIESPGNYVQTYKIDGDTRVRAMRRQGSFEDLETGDAASVYAVKSGNDYLAKVIGSRGEPSDRLRELMEGETESG